MATTNPALGKSTASAPESLPARSLARSTSLLSLGNIASRVLGLLRETVIAALFGASGQLDVFRIASQVPMLTYDFLVGGLISSALVPTLSSYAGDRAKRAEFVQVAATLVALFTLLLGGLVLLLMLAAPWLTLLLAQGFAQTNPELLPLTTRLIRLALPVVMFSGLAGVLMAILYALQRFSFPAVATAVYNLGILTAAPLLGPLIGVTSLVVGLLLGSAAQLLLMAWDVRRWYRASHDESGGDAESRSVPLLRLLLRPAWRHPALRRIVRLYLPIAVGMAVMLFQVGLDRRLATSTGTSSISWMGYATTLQQMPLGLISVAISLAALPRLSQYFAAQDEAAYQRTLVRGLRIVLLLIAPAAVGLWLLAEPTTRVIFQHGRFTPQDGEQVVAALDIYLIGMLFAAVDFPLNYAFYARNNTLLPALVGVLSVGVYVVVALGLLEPLGFLGLVWADSAKQASHALVMVGLMAWVLRGGQATNVERGPALGGSLARGLLSIGGAALGMVAAMWTLRGLVAGVLPSGFFGDLLLIVLVGGAGVAVYGALLLALRLDEARELLALGKQRLGRKF